MNDKQKELLKKIVGDKYAIGPFSGMIYNAKITNQATPTERLVEIALDVRLKLEELAK